MNNLKLYNNCLYFINYLFALNVTVLSFITKSNISGTLFRHKSIFSSSNSNSSSLNLSSKL